MLLPCTHRVHAKLGLLAFLFSLDLVGYGLDLLADFFEIGLETANFLLDVGYEGVALLGT